MVCEYCEPGEVTNLLNFEESDGRFNHLELEATDDDLQLQVSFGTERERMLFLPYCPFCGRNVKKAKV